MFFLLIGNAAGGRKKATSKGGYLAKHIAFFGVADGARTHDNRNHNPMPKTS